MKVKKNDPGFVPFDLILSVETEEEARALYAIFNYTSNLDLLPREVAHMRHLIGDRFDAAGPGSVIAEGVSRSDFYRSKA